MNDEIKGIFDTKLYFDLEEEDYIKIKNYITNLQKENKSLKGNCKVLGEKDNGQRKAINKYIQELEKLRKEKEDYKSRVEKAVEYIKNDMPYLQEIDKEYEDMDGNAYFTYKEWDDTDLLNILQLGSENE